MKNVGKIAVALIFIVVLFVAYSNCGNPDAFRRRGTSTGNPLNEKTVGETLISDACGLLKRCYPAMGLPECYEAYFNSNAVSTRLGYVVASDEVEPTFREVIALEASESIVPSFSTAVACRTSTQNLSCDADGVKQAYDNISQFKTVETVFNPAPEICGSIYLRSSN
ncbi:MAG: hypothetical protein IT289_11075 [Oligoflexia bacterium]|nr:hypothetical protein [Oligoflexia bacterium]